jgi:hypothetical protein
MPAFRHHPHPLFALCLPQHGLSVTPAAITGSFARRRAVLSALFIQRYACQNLIFGCQSSVKPCQFSNINKNIKVFNFIVLVLKKEKI